MRKDEYPPFGKRRSRAERQQDAAAVIEDVQAIEGIKRRPHGEGPREQLQRDLTIYRASMRGIDIYDLADMHGLSVEQTKVIVAAYRKEHQRLSDMNPVDVVEEMTTQVDSAISELAAESARNKGSVRVTAITNRLNGIMNKGRWLQSMGILPQEASELRVNISYEQTLNDIFGVLEERGLLTPEVLLDINRAMPGQQSIEMDTTAVEVDEHGNEVRET